MKKIIINEARIHIYTHIIRITIIIIRRIKIIRIKVMHITTNRIILILYIKNENKLFAYKTIRLLEFDKVLEHLK